MPTDTSPICRRTFLTASVAMAAACSRPSHAQRSALQPESFGARGDGRTDDTAALQRCFDAAGPGGTIRLRRGAVYRVDTNFRPLPTTQLGGLRLKDRQRLELNGAELRALPTIHSQGCIVMASSVHGWRIIGPGLIRGERDVHRGEGGEWGMGIAAFGAMDWTIGPGIRIEQCWGDGIYVGNNDPSNFCGRFRIDGVEIAQCRRNGISVVAGRDGEIRSVHIHDIGGASPGGGIDIEGEMLTPVENQNIRIIGGRIYRTEVGIYVTSTNDDILIANMDMIEGRNSGILIGNPARNVEIRGNRQIRSLAGGQEGAAIRTVVYEDSHQVENLRIVDNGISGGGSFTVDIVGNHYRDVMIRGNRIHANSRGVLGVARLGRVTFTDNVCVMEPPAGQEGHFFLYMAHSSHGRNVYRNRTAFNMWSVLTRTTDLGGDVYEGPRLTRVVG